jgi:hypothetical protein
MSGSFGDWLFSPAIAPATEGGSQKFTTEFQIKSVTGVDQGMSMNIAPQTAGGARMTNLRFEDGVGGIHVKFSDVLNLDEVTGYYPAAESWRTEDIATLSYADTHTVKIVMNLIPGPHNDVVQVYIDGSAGLVPGRTGEATPEAFYAPVDNQPTVNKAKAGQTIPLKWRLAAPSFATSWEDYYRYNSESNGGEPNPANWTTRQVDSLIFQARCAAAGPCANPTAKDAGYLIDNVSYESAALGTPLPVTSQGVSDPSVYNNPPIKVKAETCGQNDDYDVIEIYASNANGLMYHGNGVWQYNWQTPKSLATKCVQVTLDPVGTPGGLGSTDFFFTK